MSDNNNTQTTPKRLIPNDKVWLIVDFLICFLGLQASYLVWGMMQELIMDTQFTPTPLTPKGKFPSATFCVFSNRFLALIASGIACYAYHGRLDSNVPLIRFTPCALSNTLSSWSQYQALTCVSFSLQTIFKSIKILPVMLMGKFLKGTQYSLMEQLEAILITMGVMLFSMSKSNWVSSNPKYEFIGIILLCLYVLFDSFTSQWQSKLYKDYGKIDSFQMMYGVNISALVITSVALIFSGELYLVYEFFSINPGAMYYNLIGSLASATGQFAIFYTIKKFGPIVFTIMMTTRQMLSIIISNYVFNHPMSFQMYLGALLVFGSILHSTYRQFQKKSSQDNTKQQTNSSQDTRPLLNSTNNKEENVV